MSRWNSPGSPFNRARRAHLWRPNLEILEGRCLPSTVTNLNDAGDGSLRQAILDTPAGGTVDFQQGLSGTITLTTGELLINKDLTIAGPGADVITVRGNQASRVFHIAATFTVDISGLTIAAGGASNAYGGGIFSTGTLTVSACTLSGNSAGSSGGGIYSLGPLTITNSTLSGNSASYGGAIYNGSALPSVITYSTLSGNTASDGGGVYSLGPLTITNSTLSGNSAGDGGGGGIDNFGPLTITNSTLSGNSATLGGGGGGIDNFNALTITSATLSRNSAQEGGGIDTVGTQAGTAVRNMILAGNTAEIFPDLRGPLRSQGHNLIGNGTGGSGYDATDLVGTSSNPIDPKLGPLADNGGPTQTRALLPGSPAIDAGDNTDAPPWDQRGPGFHRIVNGTIDIGAFEVQARGNPAPTGESLPDPVPVQVVGMPDGPLLRQPPVQPADPFPLPGIPEGQAGQPAADQVPASTAGGQLAAEAFFAGDARIGQPGNFLGPLGTDDLDPLALELLGRS